MTESMQQENSLTQARAREELLVAQDSSSDSDLNQCEQGLDHM